MARIHWPLPLCAPTHQILLYQTLCRLSLHTCCGVTPIVRSHDISPASAPPLCLPVFAPASQLLCYDASSLVSTKPPSIFSPKISRPLSLPSPIHTLTFSHLIAAQHLSSPSPSRSTCSAGHNLDLACLPTQHRPLLRPHPKRVGRPSTICA